MSQPASVTGAGAKRWVGRALSVLALLTTAILPFAVLTDTGWSASERLHLIGAVLAFGVTGTGLVALLLRPTPSARVQVVAATAAIFTLTLVIGDPDNHGGQAGPFDPAYLIFLVPPVLAAAATHPHRSQEPATVRPVLFGLALLGAVPAATYAVTQALRQRDSWPPASDPHHNSHWYVMAVAAAGLVVLAAVAAAGRPGWRLPAFSAGVGAALLGAVMTAYPVDASNPGRAWGIAAVGWGVTVLVATGWPGHRGARDGATDPRMRSTSRYADGSLQP